MHLVHYKDNLQIILLNWKWATETGLEFFRKNSWRAACLNAIYVEFRWFHFIRFLNLHYDFCFSTKSKSISWVILLLLLVRWSPYSLDVGGASLLLWLEDHLYVSHIVAILDIKISSTCLSPCDNKNFCCNYTLSTHGLIY